MAISTSDLFPVGDIKILEYIDSSIVTPDDTKVVTLSTAVDLSKSLIIMLGWQGSSVNMSEATVRAELTSTTQATFTRGNGAATAYFQALVVSSDDLISLQYVSITTNGVISNTATISAVDSINNNIFLFPSNSTGSNAPYSLAKAVLTNSTTITAQRNSATGNAVTGVFVLELRQ